MVVDVVICEHNEPYTPFLYPCLSFGFWASFILKDKSKVIVLLLLCSFVPYTVCGHVGT